MKRRYSISQQNPIQFLIVIRDMKNTIIVLFSFETEPRCISA